MHGIHLLLTEEAFNSPGHIHSMSSFLITLQGIDSLAQISLRFTRGQLWVLYTNCIHITHFSLYAPFSIGHIILLSP